MPRPKSREGNSEQLCIKVSIALLEEIDAARGEQSRPDWGRNAFLAALGHKPASFDFHGIKVITDERMPPGTAALVSQGRDGVSVSAFSLDASEPEPEQAGKSRAKAACPHRLPPGAYCKTCGRAK